MLNATESGGRDLSDADLLQRVQRGDVEAFAPVVRRHLPSLGSPFNARPIEDYHRFRERVAQVGEAEAARQAGLVVDDSAAIVSEAEMAKDPAVHERLKQRPRMPGFNLRPAGGGEEGRKMSHAWAVSGRRSTTPHQHPRARLEAAFRVILRQGTAPEDVDAKLAECRDYVKGNPGLTEQLRSAAVWGAHLIEESAAGRLEVRYGSPRWAAWRSPLDARRPRPREAIHATGWLAIWSATGRCVAMPATIPATATTASFTAPARLKLTSTAAAASLRFRPVTP